MQQKRSNRPSPGLRVRLASLAFSLFTLSLVILPLGTCGLAGTDAKSQEPDFAQLFDRIEYSLNRYYLDLSRSNPRHLLERALSALENAADEIYVDDSDPDQPFVKIHVGDKSKVLYLNRIRSLKTAFAYLKSTFEFIHDNYEGNSSINEIRYATANGLLTGLDPHTLVFSPEAFKEFYVHIEGEIFGVGMLVGVRKGRLHVIQVLKDTPAFRAGFRNGDIITKIGDESTINMTVNEAVGKIRGPKGEKVVLTVKRRESKETKTLKTIEIPVARDRVVIKSVESKLLPDGLGYVDVRNFDKNTVLSLRYHLELLQRQNGGKKLAGLILDLRQNSGGLLKQASEMSDLFLKKGALYHIADRDGVNSHLAEDDGNEPEFPIVVLSSEASASGAEIVIGALQKNNRAVVLGTPTFGKGSVQQLHSLRQRFEPEDFDAQLKITVSEYLIPGEISIQENGVVPDILAQRVSFTEKEVDLFPDQRRGTEKDYEHHIVSKYAKKQEPVERLRYPYVFQPEEEEFGDPFMAGEIKPLEDTLVQIAVDLLRMARGKPFDRAEFLAQNKAGIDDVRKRQFDEIVRILGERKIDWSGGKNPDSKPQIELDVNQDIIERPSADEDNPYPDRVLVLRARATNRSDSTLYRLAGVTDSKYLLLSEREFLFGKIAPGETIERSLETVLFPGSASRSDRVTVALRAPGLDGSIAAKSIDVVQEGEKIPEVRFALDLRDAVSGDPLDSLSPGAKVSVKARVENIGDQTMKKGVAILRNKSGKDIFLDVGRIEIENLAPGATRSVSFEFHVRPDSALESYDFEFGVADSYYPTGISREFSIPSTDTRGDGGYENGRWFEAPSIELSVSRKESGEDPTGSETALVTTDQKVYVSARVDDASSSFNSWVSATSLEGPDIGNPDKVFFAKSSPRDGENRAELHSAVPLKFGQNVIAVVAKNDDGLTRQRIVYVRRAGHSVETAAK